MSTKYKFRDQDQLYFVSFAVINWIDLFIREEYKTIMLDSWRYCMNNKGMDLYEWSRLRRDDESYTHDNWLAWGKTG